MADIEISKRVVIDESGTIGIRGIFTHATYWLTSDAAKELELALGKAVALAPEINRKWLEENRERLNYDY